MAAPPPLLKTYNDAFALVAADPYQQNYGPLSHAFRSNNAPPDSNELYFRVASSDTTYPNAFLCGCLDLVQQYWTHLRMVNGHDSR